MYCSPSVLSSNSTRLNSTLNLDLLQVPLLVSLPNQVERQDIYSPTSCVDLLPGFEPNVANKERSIYALDAKFSSK